MARLADIPQLSLDGRYACDIPWSYLEEWLESHAKRYSGLDLSPDFQRGHVWTDAQRSRFVEFCLAGGRSSQTLYWNAPAFGAVKRNRPGQDLPTTLVLVDGMQRLESVRRFMRNELPAFGLNLLEWEDHERVTRMGNGYMFRMQVNDLLTRKAVLQWYLDLNAGGTAHEGAEIARVRDLLAAA